MSSDAKLSNDLFTSSQSNLNIDRLLRQRKKLNFSSNQSLISQSNQNIEKLSRRIQDRAYQNHILNLTSSNFNSTKKLSSSLLLLN